MKLVKSARYGERKARNNGFRRAPYPFSLSRRFLFKLVYCHTSRFVPNELSAGKQEKHGASKDVLLS